MPGNASLSLFSATKIYTPKSTHLIVEKMESTEKILCFVASGKWVITHSYLKRCLAEKRFVNEDDSHVSKRFKKSKLANVSLKWREMINEKKQNAPFFNWKVGLYLQDEEKAKALLRIIRAGSGQAMYFESSSSIKQSDKLTLLIYDSLTRDSVRTMAGILNVPCYPFQAIPDYLMQCIISDKPVLPISHYEKLEGNMLQQFGTLNSYGSWFRLVTTFGCCQVFPIISKSCFNA